MRKPAAILFIIGFAATSFCDDTSTLKSVTQKRELPSNYYHQLAAVHEKYGVYDKAVEAYQQAIATEKESQQKQRYYSALAKLYLKMEKPKEADKILAGMPAEDHGEIL